MALVRSTTVVPQATPAPVVPVAATPAPFEVLPPEVTQSAEVDQAPWEEEQIVTEAPVEDEAPAPYVPPAVSIPPAPTQALAPAPTQSTAVAATNPTQALAQAGFEGVELGARSFPIISLKNNTRFEDTDGVVYGDKIFGYIQSSRIKYVWSAYPRDNKKTIFSYDGVHSTSGVPVDTLIQKYGAEGFTMTKREYRDALILMDGNNTEVDGELRILSIPPQSKDRLNGLIQQIMMINRGDPNAVRTTLISAEVGKIIKAGDNEFAPWVFKIAR